MKKGFEIGDVTCLNSGGPEMTVSGVEALPKYPKRIVVTVVWHSAGKVQRATFEDRMLRKSLRRHGPEPCIVCIGTKETLGGQERGGCRMVLHGSALGEEQIDVVLLMMPDRWSYAEDEWFRTEVRPRMMPGARIWFS